MGGEALAEGLALGQEGHPCPVLVGFGWGGAGVVGRGWCGGGGGVAGMGGGFGEGCEWLQNPEIDFTVQNPWLLM